MSFCKNKLKKASLEQGCFNLFFIPARIELTAERLAEPGKPL